jgi:glycosyltransferase involved in cell wall biosynthesis
MTGPRPAVSIIIPSYNAAATIPYTIEGLLSQVDPSMDEILVVDSSDDGRMAAVVERFEPRGVRFLHEGRKVIPAKGRNIGAGIASGDILAFIDADAFPEAGWIDAIVSSYRSGCRAGGGSVLLPEWQAGNRIAVAQYYLQFNESILTKNQSPEIRPFLPSVNLYCDRKLFLAAGGFPDIRAAEDTLLGIRISRETPIWYDPSIKVRHIFRENRADFRGNQRLLGQYNLIFRREAYPAIWYRGFLPILLSPLIGLYKGIRILARIARAGQGHLSSLAPALPWFFEGLYFWTAGFLSTALTREAKVG